MSGFFYMKARVKGAPGHEDEFFAELVHMTPDWPHAIVKADGQLHTIPSRYVERVDCVTPGTRTISEDDLDEY